MVLSKCGYRCDLCKAYPANVAQNDGRPMLSAMWKKYYDLDIPAEAIVCAGCDDCSPDAKRLDDGCPVRPCAMERGVAHCGECTSKTACKRIDGRLGITREESRARLGDAHDEQEFDEYILAFDNRARLGMGK